MSTKKVLLAVFILVALAQIAVPAKMIWDREEVLAKGKVFKFKTQPIDPTDPFRGKYIVLRYKRDTVHIKNEKNWSRGEQVYAYLTEDKDGFARVDSVSKEKLNGSEHFIKTKVNYVFYKNAYTPSAYISIDFPFERFYMEESKAYEAELTHIESQQDTSSVTYALVAVKEGKAVLKDVLIDDVPIRDLVIERLNSK